MKHIKSIKIINKIDYEFPKDLGYFYDEIPEPVGGEMMMELGEDYAQYGKYFMAYAETLGELENKFNARMGVENLDFETRTVQAEAVIVTYVAGEKEVLNTIRSSGSKGLVYSDDITNAQSNELEDIKWILQDLGFSMDEINEVNINK